MPRTAGILAGLAFVAAVILGPVCCYADGAGFVSNSRTVERIVSAGKEDNGAMRNLDYLVNNIGSRPVGSVNFLRACKWARDEFQRLGLENVHLEKCGEIKGDFSGVEETALFKRLYRSMFGEDADNEMVPIYNVIADIPGSGSPDEYVIVGAHLDSAPQGPGATDNGTGVAAVMEASRMLAASGVRPRRTIRFILFGGEEAGLVGSNGYVDAHPGIIPNISAVYNMDHGANFISGIVATEPLLADMREIFSYAMKLDPGMPFEVEEVEYLPAADPDCCAVLVEKMKDERGMRRVVDPGETGDAKGCGALDGGAGEQGITIKEVTADGDTLVKRIIIAGAPGGGKYLDPENLDLEALGIPREAIEAGGDSLRKMVAIGSSDHAPFLAAGIPAFWWEQEEDETVPYPAHTGEDTYDKVNARYLEHSAAVIALGAFGTANLGHMLSREKLTSPEGTPDEGGRAVEGKGRQPSCGSKAEKPKRRIIKKGC